MNSRLKIAPLLLLALLPGEALCQIAVGIQFPHSDYIRFEPVKATVRIQNDTDTLLIIGGIGEGATLDFDVRTKDQFRLKRKTSCLTATNVIVLPGKIKEISVDVAAHYDLQPHGQYCIKAEISTSANRYLSTPQVIDIVPGIELQTVERAVPSQPTVMRTYKLLYWTRNDVEHLFLTVTDKEQRTVYGIFDLGSVMRFVPPSITVDVSGNVTVRHQPDHDVTILTFLQSLPQGVSFLRQESKVGVAPAQ